MAKYMLVDADQLDADLEIVADSIRDKGGTSDKLTFPEGFKNAVDAISKGIAVQTKSGSFSTGSNGHATVSCGFKPDMLYVTKGESYQWYKVSACFAFHAAGSDRINTGMWTGETVIDGYATRNESGASLNMKTYDESWNEIGYAGMFSYVAVKYT